MKKLILITLLFCSCGSIENDDLLINQFVNKGNKPIIVRYHKLDNVDGKMDVTLINCKGEVLYLKYTTVLLPDTIN